ncbi:MAG: polysaccharide deacetylase family protein [Thermodesulfobacteriota bacterium]
MKPPVKKTSLTRFLSLPHTMCLFAAFVFFVVACACVAQGTGSDYRGPALRDAASGPIVETAGKGLKALAAAAPRPAPQAASVEVKKHAPVLKDTTAAPVRAAAIPPPDITRGDTSSMEVAFTFDGGEGKARDADRILDVLKERGIKATVFLTGRFIRENPAVVRRIVREGHEVGNHTFNHPHLTEYARSYTQRTLGGVDERMVRRELDDAAALFRETTGREMAPLWRAPYGEVNRELRLWAWEAGYVHVGWTSDYENRQSLDTLDWVDDPSSRFYRSSSEIKERVLGFGRDGDGVRGGIVLMHLNTLRKSDSAVEVLGPMLDELGARGYRFVKVSTLLAGNRYLKEALRRRSAQVALAPGTPSARPGGLAHR